MNKLNSACSLINLFVLCSFDREVLDQFSTITSNTHYECFVKVLRREILDTSWLWFLQGMLVEISGCGRTFCQRCSFIRSEE